MTNLTYAITGVATGIGAALAAVLKRQGHTVIGFDIKETTDNIDDFIHVDLADESSVSAATNKLNTRLDGLCNVAGIPPRDGLESAILIINFTAQRQFTQRLIPHLNAGASVVNMASRAGHGWLQNVDQVKRLAVLKSLQDIQIFVEQEKLNPTQCYNLSKQAMILWTLAENERFIKNGMRVNSISPGGISTGILNDFKKAFGDQMARNVERAGRPGEAIEVAEVAAFILSPASHWIKGTDVPVDGGMGAFGLCDQLDLAKLCID